MLECYKLLQVLCNTFFFIPCDKPGLHKQVHHIFLRCNFFIHMLKYVVNVIDTLFGKNVTDANTVST